MDDRKLLDLAAKASGNTVYSTAGLGVRSVMHWNPLDDDGDCARMESALLLRVNFHDGWVSVGHESFGKEWQCEFFSAHGGDRNKARRVASVFAAAQIGGSMR